jgi:dCMP deaminase
MSTNSLEKWDRRFFEVACLVGSWSKDTTKVGSVLVKDKRILSTGFNGMPALVSDDPELYSNRKVKLERIVHAEANAIVQCTVFGLSTLGSTLYSTKFPCLECSKLIISAGIVRIVSLPYFEYSRWYKNNLKSEAFFKEAGLDITFLEL